MTLQATDRVLGNGTLLRGDLSGANSAGAFSYTQIACVTDLNPPPHEKNMEDGTVLEDSREYMRPGIGKATDFKFEAMWKEGSTLYEDFVAAHNSETDCGWQIVYPFGTPKTDTFTGFIKKVGVPKVAVKDYLKCEVEVTTTTDGVVT